MVGSTKLTAEELVQSARPWYWHTSTCTHGGYGRCKEGCKKEGFWGYVPKLGKETWLGELLWKADIPVVLGAVNSHDAVGEAERLWDVMNDDEDGPGTYELVYGGKNGDAFYAAMTAVKEARNGS